MSEAAPGQWAGLAMRLSYPVSFHAFNCLSLSTSTGCALVVEFRRRAGSVSNRVIRRVKWFAAREAILNLKQRRSRSPARFLRLSTVPANKAHLVFLVQKHAAHHTIHRTL